MVKAKEIITNLVEGFGISKEILAGKMHISVRTITRWGMTGEGNTQPTYAELEKLNRIYRGYKSTKRKARR